MSVPVSSPLRRYRRRILGWGSFGVVVLCGVAAPLFVRSVESDLEHRVPSELAERGFEGVSAAFSGQDGVLRCTTPLAEPEDAIDAAIEVWGVRAIGLDRSCRASAASTEGTDGVSTEGSDVVPATTLGRTTGGTTPDAADTADTADAADTADTADAADADDAADDTADDTVTGVPTSPTSPPGSTEPAEPDPTVSDDEVAALQTELDVLIDANPILFEQGSADVSDEASTVLDQIAAILEPFDGVAITIEGHTDSGGEPADNQTLSDLRALVVLEGLVERGVPAAALTSVGLGSTRPIVVDGEEDEDESRRVEFRVTTQAA